MQIMLIKILRKKPELMSINGRHLVVPGDIVLLESGSLMV